ncbi:hypothetical protein OH76DRAFT_1411033 [Lentinus brumalis]|uniref:Uncharacterized protein n=1 Tax=Lentinus brumalis TaxID=2498619 RepID=A0A371CQP3_9APHY|nr:hypothetical protein OH76DRAFT_1411033 [Polyporus brumalis]
MESPLHIDSVSRLDSGHCLRRTRYPAHVYMLMLTPHDRTLTEALSKCRLRNIDLGQRSDRPGPKSHRGLVAARRQRLCSFRSFVASVMRSLLGENDSERTLRTSFSLIPPSFPPFPSSPSRSSYHSDCSVTYCAGQESITSTPTPYETHLLFV